jgi:uncharacterized membrane protein YidH (DUF202 family)
MERSGMKRNNYVFVVIRLFGTKIVRNVSVQLMQFGVQLQQFAAALTKVIGMQIKLPVSHKVEQFGILIILCVIANLLFLGTL